MNVRDEDQQSRQGLTALRYPEFRSLFDGGACIAAGVGQSDDFGLRGLRLKQERRKIGRPDRMPNRADYLCIVRRYRSRAVALQRVPERIVGGEEEPWGPAAFDDGLNSRIGYRPGIE